MSSFRLGLLVILVVMVGMSLTYLVLDPLSQSCTAAQRLDATRVCIRHTEMMLALTLVCTAVLTLFGTLALPGAQNEDGNFREPRIRFAIAITVLMLYLVYFCMAVFWTEGTSQKMVETLTNLMMVVIPFYFGASAAAQVAQKK